MKALRVLCLALLAALTLAVRPATAQVSQQQAVNQALSTIERMKGDANFQKTFLPELKAARAVLIIPSLYKAGFIVGGQYGNGVLMVHEASGEWSYPAFYRMSGGSIGLQFGAVDTAIVLVIRTEGGLNALLDKQFKFGADAGITVVAVGAGMGAATTGATQADIVAFSLGGVGLFGGVALEGSVLSPRESWNAAYYGEDVSARSIVTDHSAINSQADRLRDFLGH